LQQRKAATSVEPATVDDLRAGRIVVVAPVVDVTADGVSLADGSVLDIDLVIAATGFTTGLGPVVGHLDVLDAEGVPQVGDGRESLPGLRFIGYEFVPGVIALAADRAVRVAEEISRDPSTARRVSARPAVP
ncbi:MAG: NAD(P)/FAD-dependent oxidoreductase, partial [Propionibacterium sp.]|nr:NAD(P)/FAD-dependent oxidoreductase [Propionibacterium sp.]